MDNNARERARNAHLLGMRLYRLAFPCLLFALFAFAIPFNAHAASLGLRSAKSSYAIGETFTVDVYVNASDQKMNALSATIQIPTDFLENASITSGGSIVTVWVQSPTIAGNTASLEGIVLNPGFQGANGHVARIQARAKRAGTAEFFLRSGSVLANDGQGTNILNGLGRIALTVEAPKQAEPEPDPEPTKPSPTPERASETRNQTPETNPTPTPKEDSLDEQPLSALETTTALKASKTPMLILDRMEEVDSEPITSPSKSTPLDFRKFMQELAKILLVSGSLFFTSNSVTRIWRHARRGARPRARRHTTDSEPDLAAQNLLSTLQEDVYDAADFLEQTGKTRPLSPAENILLRRFRRDLEQGKDVLR